MLLLLDLAVVPVLGCPVVLHEVVARVAWALPRVLVVLHLVLMRCHWLGLVRRLPLYVVLGQSLDSQLTLQIFFCTGKGAMCAERHKSP